MRKRRLTLSTVSGDFKGTIFRKNSYGELYSPRKNNLQLLFFSNLYVIR
jgi:hypothetical protein